jgi:transposase
MESTGVYWVPFFQILEAAGFEVFLVNARHVKNVPGRKSDVADCQWLQYLHSVGLLRASFRPEQAVCAVRSILRHRDSLVQIVTIHVQHMQKALDQMNLQLHHVISDITGVSGMAIIEAILNGERDPMLLSQMCDKRVKASRQTIAAALVGDYRREHLFTLRQSLHAYRQDLIAACDREIEQQLAAFDSKVDPRATPLPKPKDRHKPRRNQMKFDLRSEMYRIYGVDLTAVPGIDALTAHVLFAEIGPDLSRFSTVAAFVSWLGLCPDNRVSGGKLLSVRTRLVKSRVAKALRMAAQSLHRSQSYLGGYYRRMRTRLGTPKAITAAAHKLARVIYHLLATRQPYEESVFVRCEALHQQRLENRIRRQARELGFTLVRPST